MMPMSMQVRMEPPEEVDSLRETGISDISIEVSAAEIPALGTIIDGRYEITGLIGQGGMGHVLSARHVTLGHRLAIKVLRREMTRDVEMVERFRREARAASAIGHAGIVAVKDFGTLTSGASYFVMEHVEGVVLADELENEGRFSIERALDVVRQMADALGAAHAAGIVHRDVKTENVILTTFQGRLDHVKLLDFGIAKLDFASRLSGAHRILGTPAYMSPEQARGQSLDRRADVYALGILFYELLTGHTPFENGGPIEILRQQIMVAAPSVLTLRPEVPEAIADAIARCLAKNPDERPASMAALSELLASAGPARVVERSFAFAISLPVVEPVVVAEASAPPSPPTPVRAPVSVAPSVRAPISSAVIAAAGVLIVIGVATLAAAIGIVARRPAARVSVESSRPMGATSVSVEREQGVVIAAPSPIAAPVVIAPPIARPSPTLSSAPHPRATHAPHLDAPPSTTPPSATAAAPPLDDHPTIRVIDPWQ